MKKGTKVVVTGKKMDNSMIVRSGTFISETQAKSGNVIVLIRDNFRRGSFRSYIKGNVVLIPQH